MKKGFIALAICLGLTSCTTVQIETIPPKAQLTVGQDKPPRLTPCQVHIPYFTSPVLTVTHPGFIPQDISLDLFPTGQRKIVLKRVLKVNTTPPQAILTLNQKPRGETPAELILPADSKPQKLVIARKGFLPQILTIDPLGAPDTITADLMPAGPGRIACKTTFTDHGFPQVKQCLDSSLLLQMPSQDKAVCLATFPADQFPERISPIPNSPNLLISVLKNQMVRGINRPYANVLFFSTYDYAFTPFLPGQYFECSAAVIGDTVFYTSLQTGRFDLWSQKLNPQNQENTLALSNKLIKFQLTSYQKKLLYTTLDPQQQDNPRIWIAKTDHSYLTSHRELCNGEQPNWTPKGWLIAFQKTSLKPQPEANWFPITAIWTIKTDGSLKNRLTEPKATYTDKNPAWTPDGNYLIFASNRNSKTPNNFNLWIMDRNGGNQRQLTFSEATDDFPMPTPDGKAVIFRSNRNLKWGLWKIDLP